MANSNTFNLYKLTTTMYDKSTSEKSVTEYGEMWLFPQDAKNILNRWSNEHYTANKITDNGTTIKRYSTFAVIENKSQITRFEMNITA